MDVRLHLGGHRIIRKGQKVHSSLWQGSGLNNSKSYTPKACPLNESSFWTKEKEQLGEWIELDFYQHVENISKDFIANLQSDGDNSEGLKILRDLVSNGQSIDPRDLVTFLKSNF